MSLEPKVELAPFRTLTDFVTDAQFSAPAVTDSARYTHSADRVCKTLNSLIGAC